VCVDGWAMGKQKDMPDRKNVSRSYRGIRYKRIFITHFRFGKRLGFRTGGRGAVLNPKWFS